MYGFISFSTLGVCVCVYLIRIVANKYLSGKFTENVYWVNFSLNGLNNLHSHSCVRVYSSIDLHSMGSCCDYWCAISMQVSLYQYIWMFGDRFAVFSTLWHFDYAVSSLSSSCCIEMIHSSHLTVYVCDYFNHIWTQSVHRIAKQATEANTKCARL